MTKEVVDTMLEKMNKSVAVYKKAVSYTHLTLPTT